MGRKKQTQGLTPWQQAVQKEKLAGKPDWYRKAKNKKQASGKRLLASYQIRNFKRFWPFLTGVILLIGCMVFLVLPISRVAKVRITGNQIVSKSQLQHYFPVKSGDSMFKVWGKKTKLADQLKKSSQRVESAEVATFNFNNVQVKVSEYPTIGYLYQAGGFQPILKSGVIINKKILNPQAGYPILKNFKDAKILQETINPMSGP